MQRSFVTATVLIFLCSATGYADVKLGPLFCDGVVLQRNKPVVVWGWADAGENVTVRFEQQSKTANAGADGKWSVTLAPLTASDQPQDLLVAGRNSIKVSGILVGEVWLCSGQSNMNFPLSATRDAKAEIVSANFPLIHYFDVMSSILEQPAESAEGSWEKCSPQTAGSFSAVAYYFAKELHPEVGVPIGIIKASLGGSPIEGWIGADVIASTPASEPAIKEWHKLENGYIQRAEEFKKALTDWNSRRSKAESSGERFTEAKPTRPWVDSDRNKPSGLYNGFIHPLQPFTLAGFLWYQGEGNVPRAAEYKVLFPLMIEQWRRDFKQPALPFLFVQLPNYVQKNDSTEQSWAWLREAQDGALKLPHVGMAVTLDIGDPVDLHPANKRDVGKRLARIAQKRVYGQAGQDSGPVHGEIKRDGDAFRIRFQNADGLTLRGDVSGMFVVAGVDKKFVPAEARIEGDTVVVSAAGVKDPMAVRFEWSNNPQGFLVNRDGLPAAPFRSDDWPR